MKKIRLKAMAKINLGPVSYTHLDSHQIPFSMAIDFQSIVAALKEIHYQGYFTLEASYYLENYPKDEVLKGVKELAKSARKLAEMFEQEV